ncbi:OmpA family protein [Methylovirgula sp. 4M-Z18]|uniref:OmpA family protein n=1 Tax=Methylovirgula sp. 4M-Z18 TaxID=2293567 RepID=UPI000E2E477B|nr:OmpA family protein [Methylovirgula sp. 4M-Z18]RFB80960.1 OmpA family protein [Methylovirgula sp. 4M-Z18]
MADTDIRPAEKTDIDRLRRLLLGDGEEKLQTVEERLEAIDRRVGSPDRLENATAEVLAGALRRAEVDRHKELATAIAPLVVAAIRSEIKNSKDMMVEALYPITGRLVSAAVANAFRELITTLNEKVDALLSVQSWQLRVKSILTGQPMSALALAEASLASIDRIILLERGSGHLIADWHRDGKASENPELVSGLIAAITDFAGNVFAANSGELRNLDVGGSRIFLRPSARMIAAAQVIGPTRGEDERAIDTALVDLLERHDRDELITTDKLGLLADTILPKRGAQKSNGIASYALAGLLIALLGFGAWRLWHVVQHWRTERQVNAAYDATLAHDPRLAAFPLQVRFDHKRAVVHVRGILPNVQGADEITQALSSAAAPYTLDTNVETIATAQEVATLGKSVKDLQDEIAAARTSLGTLNAQLRTDLSADIQASDNKLGGTITQALTDVRAQIASDTKALQSELDQHSVRLTQIGAINDKLAAVEQATEEANALLDTPEAKLGRLVQGFAIFFPKGEATIIDRPGLSTKLDQLADFLKSTGLSIRIISHADETGSAVLNRSLGVQRATVVAAELTKRGVDQSHIATVTRSTLEPIRDGAAAANRRATFEPTYVGEPTQ